MKLSWEAIRVLLRRSRYTGAAILHCAEGVVKTLEIPPEPRPSQRFEIDNPLDNAPETGAK